MTTVQDNHWQGGRLSAAIGAAAARFLRLGAAALLLLAVQAGGAAAQTATGTAADWPARQEPFVNDLAGVIAPADAARLRDGLARLKDEIGVEMAVVTVPALPGGAGGLEAYATGLFNHWGLGAAARNDGMLMLMAPADRAVRLELGAGYSRDDALIAQDIVSRTMLPLLHEAKFSEALAAGVAEAGKRIARPHAAARPAGAAGGRTGLPGWAVPGGIFAVLALLVIGRLARRRGPARPAACPRCGTALAAGSLRAGPPDYGAAVCPACGWHEDRSNRGYSGDRLRGGPAGEGKGGEGGGKSSGGGASGRW